MIKEKQTINAEMKTNKVDGLQGYDRVHNNSIDPHRIKRKDNTLTDCKTGES